MLGRHIIYYIHIKFNYSQANVVAGKLARDAKNLTSPHTFIDVPPCIIDLVSNENMKCYQFCLLKKKTKEKNSLLPHK